MNIYTSTRRPAFCSVAFTSIACLLGAAQASADPAVGGRSVTVNYRDLDLATIAGATTLYQRLQGAARSVCDGPATGLHAYQEWRSCYQAAIADAVAKVNSPLLTAVHRGPDKNANITAMVTR